MTIQIIVQTLQISIIGMDFIQEFSLVLFYMFRYKCFSHPRDLWHVRESLGAKILLSMHTPLRELPNAKVPPGKYQDKDKDVLTPTPELPNAKVPSGKYQDKDKDVLTPLPELPNAKVHNHT